MIRYLLSLLGYRRDYGLAAAGPGRARAPGWEALSRQLRSERPECECCGLPTTVIHHVLPFHVHPSLELDKTNLIALCNECHLRIGHGGSFRAWLPDCRRLAATIRAAIAARSE